MAEDFQEELGRRTVQIQDLRDELWDQRDRVEDAEHRADNLVFNLGRLADEIRTRKDAANQLEDKAALMEGAGEEEVRRLADAAANATVRAEAASKRLEELRAERERVAQEVSRERARAESVACQVIDMQAQLRNAQRDLERGRVELEQEERDEVARRTRLKQLQEKQAAEQKMEAEGELATVSREAATHSLEVTRLEAVLAEERRGGEAVLQALQTSAGERGEARRACSVLERALAMLEGEGSEKVVQEKLAAARRQCRQLQQELATLKGDIDIQGHNLQGALEETRRMMVDHLDETRRQATSQAGGAPSSSSTSLSVLGTVLGEVQNQAAAKEATVARLRSEVDSLQSEVKAAEAVKAAAAAEMLPRRQDAEARTHGLTAELLAVRQALEAGQRQALEAAAGADSAEAKVQEVQRLAEAKEALLRTKLRELWSSLRLAGANAAAAATRN